MKKTGRLELRPNQIRRKTIIKLSAIKGRFPKRTVTGNIRIGKRFVTVKWRTEYLPEKAEEKVPTAQDVWSTADDTEDDRGSEGLAFLRRWTKKVDAATIFKSPIDAWRKFTGNDPSPVTALLLKKRFHMKEERMIPYRVARDRKGNIVARRRIVGK